MIYTIGHKKQYLQGIEDLGVNFRKLGIRLNYLGGSVFRTNEDAQSYLKGCQSHGRLSAYDVFGVKADWIDDTYYIEGEHYNRLHTTSQIVQLKNPQGDIPVPQDMS